MKDYNKDDDRKDSLVSEENEYDDEYDPDRNKSHALTENDE